MTDCNAAGEALIKSFESCKLIAYQDQRGIWTIGWGHTGPEVIEGLVWTQDQADAQFDIDLRDRAENAVSRDVTVFLTSNQFSALCSLCFNIGSGNFGSSTLVRDLNGGNLAAVPAEFLRWDKVNGQPNAGLHRRRVAEAAFWGQADQDA